MHRRWNHPRFPCGVFPSSLDATRAVLAALRERQPEIGAHLGPRHRRDPLAARHTELRDGPDAFFIPAPASVLKAGTISSRRSIPRRQGIGLGLSISRSII